MDVPDTTLEGSKKPEMEGELDSLGRPQEAVAEVKGGANGGFLLTFPYIG
jgi:hypothetical protein